MNKIEVALTKMLLSNNPAKIADACAVQCLKRVATNRVDTAATDGVVLLYNPAYLEGLTIEQVCGLLVHEVCHVRFAHHEQFADSGYTDHRQANVAMDMEINPLVADAGYELPQGGCWPSQVNEPAHRSWQAYYAKLVQAQQQQPQPSADSDEQQDGEQADEQGDEQGSSSGSDDSKSEDGEQDGQDSENAAEGQGGAGEGEGQADAKVSDGLHEPGSLTEEFAPELLEGEDGEEPAEDLAKKVADEVAKRIEDASEESKIPAPAGGTGQANRAVGTGSKNLTANGQVKTDARWQDVVIDLIASRAAGESTVDWSRPSRRSIASGSYRPARRKVCGFRLALLVDVSGSCVRWFSTWQAMARELVEAVTEITEVEVIYHDDEVIGTETWQRRSGEEVTIASRGGGGTSFCAAIEAAAGMDVDGIILFTDGEGRWPAEPAVDCVTVQPPGAWAPSPYGATVKVRTAK